MKAFELVHVLLTVAKHGTYRRVDLRLDYFLLSLPEMILDSPELRFNRVEISCEQCNLVVLYSAYFIRLYFCYYRFVKGCKPRLLTNEMFVQLADLNSLISQIRADCSVSKFFKLVKSFLNGNYSIFADD